MFFQRLCFSSFYQVPTFTDFLPCFLSTTLFLFIVFPPLQTEQSIPVYMIYVLLVYTHLKSSGVTIRQLSPSTLLRHDCSYFCCASYSEMSGDLQDYSPVFVNHLATWDSGFINPCHHMMLFLLLFITLFPPPPSWILVLWLFSLDHQYCMSSHFSTLSHLTDLFFSFPKLTYLWSNKKIVTNIICC